MPAAATRRTACVRASLRWSISPTSDRASADPLYFAKMTAWMYACRASAGSRASRRLAAESRSRAGAASPPGLCSDTMSALSHSARAYWRSSSAAASASARSSSAASCAPAACFASAAARARVALSGGSAVKVAARSRKAAVAARPPRAFARSAECSSSCATVSSAPTAACARCQTLRSGSASGSVTAPSAPCAARRSSSGASR